MKKILILLIFLILSLNITYGENTKIIDGMYLSDGYYIGKINGIDLDKNIVQFENYIRLYGYDSPINDLIKGDYKSYFFRQGLIDDFFILENKKFLNDNKNEKYITFYVNNYVDNFSEIFKTKEVDLKYINFIKCNENGKIYFDTNGYKIFPMGGGIKENDEYVKNKLGKLNSCKELEDFFSSNKKFYFSLEKQIDFRLYYFLIITIIIYIIYYIFKKTGKIICKK